MRLKAEDGAEIGAYRADPMGTPRGGIVLVQEIFGVNRHIRRVADDFAAAGYAVIAPAFFDHVRPGVELAYDEAGRAEGRALAGQVGLEAAVRDVRAAVKMLQPAGKVAVVGYCWGGTVAWLAAAEVDGVAAAVGYYGGGIAKQADLMPRCPVILHFGEKDAHIPLSDVAAVQRAHPDMAVFTYPADHGFNCEERASHDPESAALARERTLRFLDDKIG